MSKYDWNSIYFTSSHFYHNNPDLSPVAYKDAKLVSLDAELLRLANLKATTDAIIKYPDWPYKNNKRAENFLHKMEKKYYLSGPDKLCESIEIEPNGTLRIVLDDTSEDVINRALSLFEQYDGKSTFQQFGNPIKIKKKITFKNRDDFL